MQNYYPAFLNLKNRRVLVAGGGQVACRKVGKLLEAGADILIVSPELCPELAELEERESAITWLRKDVSHADIPEDTWLIVAATSNPDAQKMLWHEAERRRIFSNIVDQPDISSFIVPSSFRCGDLDLAMSTGGRSPAVARLARLELEGYFDRKWSILLDIADAFRKAVLASDLPDSRKKVICAAIGNPELLAWIAENRMDRVTEWMSDVSENEIEDDLRPVKEHIIATYGTDRKKADTGSD